MQLPEEAVVGRALQGISCSYTPVDMYKNVHSPTVTKSKRKKKEKSGGGISQNIMAKKTPTKNSKSQKTYTHFYKVPPHGKIK